MVKRKGFTLIELIIYFFLAALTLGLVVSFFQNSRRQYEATSSSYLIGQEATNAIQWIRRDLQETALSTIRITREGAKNYGMPSMSFIASGEDKDFRSFSVSRYGTPAWNRHFFYSLTDKGALYRWDKPIADLDTPTRYLPVPTTADPSDQTDAEHQKVLVREVMLPNQEIKIDAKDAPFPKVGEWGGFKPGFIIYDGNGKEHMTTQNPAQISEELANNAGGSVTTLEGESVPLSEVRTTRLLEVHLTLKLKGFRINSPSAVMIPIRVSPLH